MRCRINIIIIHETKRYYNYLCNDWILSRELSFRRFTMLYHTKENMIYIFDLIESTMRVAIFEMQKCFEYFFIFFPDIYILL